MSIIYCDKHGIWDSDNMSECPRCDYVDESSPPTVQQTTCEFCEPDGYANHAPRCPVSLEGELAAIIRDRNRLREELARSRDTSEQYRHNYEYAKGEWEKSLAQLAGVVERCAKVPNEVVWLLERGQSCNQVPTIWWKGDDAIGPVRDYESDWTTDANEAIKFPTESAAERVALKFFARPSDSALSVIITEHAFIRALSPDPPEVRKGEPDKWPECQACNGTGFIWHGPEPMQSEPCHYCAGKGYIDASPQA